MHHPSIKKSLANPIIFSLVISSIVVHYLTNKMEFQLRKTNKYRRQKSKIIITLFHWRIPLRNSTIGCLLLYLEKGGEIWIWLHIGMLSQKFRSWTDFMLCTAIVTKCSNSSYFLSPLILAFYAIGNKNFFLCQLPKLVKFDNKAIYALHGNILLIHGCDLFSCKGCKWYE